MRCTKPIRLMHLNHVEYPDGLLVPCGKCLACRIARRQEWSMRVIHELAGYKDAVFLTLTYSDDHLPDNGSLVVADLQKFFKRLRKQYAKRKNGIKLRYYACGEYGDRYGRPHYHAIVCGLSLRQEDKDLVKVSWPFGLCHFGTATPDSISYVCQYIDKKFTGDLAKIEYEDKGRAPVFRVSSLGIGRKFLEDNHDQLVHMGYCTVGGRVHSFPSLLS